MVAVKINEDNTAIHIHDDYCCQSNTADVPEILSQIGKLISGAYRRMTEEHLCDDDVNN